MNKTEKTTMEQTMVKNARDVANLWENNKIDIAFVKYESVRDLLSNVNMQFDFYNMIKYYLERKGIFNQVKWDGFKCSYTDYRKGEIATIEL